MQSDRAMPLAIGISVPHPECLSDNGAKIVYMTNFCLCCGTVEWGLVCVLLGCFWGQAWLATTSIYMFVEGQLLLRILALVWLCNAISYNGVTRQQDTEHTDICFAQVGKKDTLSKCTLNGHCVTCGSISHSHSHSHNCCGHGLLECWPGWQCKVPQWSKTGVCKISPPWQILDGSLMDIPVTSCLQFWWFQASWRCRLFADYNIALGTLSKLSKQDDRSPTIADISRFLRQVLVSQAQRPRTNKPFPSNYAMNYNSRSSSSLSREADIHSPILSKICDPYTSESFPTSSASWHSPFVVCRLL